VAGDALQILQRSLLGEAIDLVDGVVARSVIEDPVENRLPLVRQPTIVIHGEDDTLISMDWAERVAALLPRGRLVVVPGATHVVHYTSPQVVANLVQSLVEARTEELAPL